MLPALNHNSEENRVEGRKSRVHLLAAITSLIAVFATISHQR